MGRILLPLLAPTKPLVEFVFIDWDCGARVDTAALADWFSICLGDVEEDTGPLMSEVV